MKIIYSKVAQKKPKKIIQIAGKKHSGKTFLASKIFDSLSRKGYRIYKTSFASHLKSALRNIGVEKDKPSKIVYHFDTFYNSIRAEIFRLFDKYYPNEENIKTYLRKRAFLGSLVAKAEILEKFKKGFELYFKQNKYAEGYRILAQTLGTDVFRTIDEDFWVNALLLDLKQVAPASDFVLIDDYRFPNEDLSRYYGDVVFRILLKTDEQDNNDNHPSEVMVDKVPYDLYVVRQGTVYTPSFGHILQKILA